MSENEAVVKRRKKFKTQKSKTKHGKLKRRQEEEQRQQQKQQKRKIQLSQEFEENEKDVMTLLENTSLFSESSNNSHHDDDGDNKSPSERFFFGSKQQPKTNIVSANETEESSSGQSQYDERLSRGFTDDLSFNTKTIKPTWASTFIEIDTDGIESLVRVERAQHFAHQSEFVYKPQLKLETSLTSFTLDTNINRNTVAMINRYIMESKIRKEKVDKNILMALKDLKCGQKFFNDNVLYKTLCEYKFSPIFIEPSFNSFTIPVKKLLTICIKDLRFTEHPLLQEEHRLANNLELLFEHRVQRLNRKITEKLYADLQIERNIVNDLLRSAENGGRVNKEKKALKLENHLYKVKALREKLYDEEFANKQLLQEILNSWLKLKHLRSQQESHFTRLKIRIKIEDLKEAEIKRRQSLWKQRFQTDLNEIYREQLEEYYRKKRLRQQHKIREESRKPNIKKLSQELEEKYAKSFFNPKEPRIEVARVVSSQEYKDLPGLRNSHVFFMRIFFDGQMVGETRAYHLQSDLSVNVNENIGIVLNRSLPKDIRIKLYKKAKISTAQKIANILVPLPLPATIQPDSHTITVTFSSHKQPISGYMRLSLQNDEDFYPNEILNTLFPLPRQNTTIPKNLLRDWYHRNLLDANEISDPSLLRSDSHSDTEDDTETLKAATTNTCTFQEDLLRFCDPLELENNQRLKLLRSRYLQNDERTRDLKYIPMLDHEIEFEWEMKETIIDPGNWMDPIDLHKHEGKKYLRHLYAALSTQCTQLSKLVASRENLLTNDEPISWSAFFQTVKLLYQPRLILNMDHKLSITSNTRCLTMDQIQSFRIICNIIRATGIPVRITNPQDTDNKSSNSPQSANMFILKNLKYSNVRPFIAVSYKDEFCRTMTAEGSNPTWNEQLVLQLSSSLADLHDDLRISLYDEIIENQLNDDPDIRNVDIYQRIQNNWLGEYRIPINAILTQQKMDCAFELCTPRILIGYKKPALENISRNAETNIKIEQFPEIKESVRLWCYISLEPNFELPLINSKCLECSELIDVREHLSNWRLQALELQPQRFMEPLVCTSEGIRLCITRLFQPLAPPVEASENLLDTACRFVSLIARLKFYDPCIRFAGVWLNNQLVLDTTWASPKDLGVLLCNYLLYIGLQCSLVLGMSYAYGDCTFVLYRNEQGEMLLIDPCTGKRYGLKDVFCPLQSIKLAVTPNNFYLNIQTESRVSMMSFNWNDTSCWLPGFSKKNPAPLGGFQSFSYKYSESYNTSELKYNIERKIMKKISSWRIMRKTIWNRAFQPRLLSILQHMEQSVTFETGSSYEELKYNNMLAAEFPNYKIFGFTLNFTYTNLNQISERIKTTGIHLNTNKNVEYSLAVHIHPYPNNILSVWLFLITIVPI